MELFGDRGATDNRARLDDAYLEAGRCEVAGAGQSLVAGTDDDRVIARLAGTAGGQDNDDIDDCR